MIPDVDYLDDVLLDGPRGRMRLLPASTLQAIPHDHLRLWAHRRARYGLPTVELVEWLRTLIRGRSAIEVGSGMGDLGYHLGIPMTDSHAQIRLSDVAAWLAVTSAPPTAPPPDVEVLDANTAVEKYKPEVVVASWLTQIYVPGDEGPPAVGSSIYGTNEYRIVKTAKLYVHIGNERIHGDKRILKKPHKVYRFPWIVSKAECQDKNVIYVWSHPS